MVKRPFPGLLFADYLVIRCHMVRHIGSIIEETIRYTNCVYEIS
jgi:hypothetical protein